MTTSGADMWLYSVRAWCSPNQAYFQLCLSAWMTNPASRINCSCSLAGSWAAGPGMYPLTKMPNSTATPTLSLRADVLMSAINSEPYGSRAPVVKAARSGSVADGLGERGVPDGLGPRVLQRVDQQERDVGHDRG